MWLESDGKIWEDGNRVQDGARFWVIARDLGQRPAIGDEEAWGHFIKASVVLKKNKGKDALENF